MVGRPGLARGWRFEHQEGHEQFETRIKSQKEVEAQRAEVRHAQCMEQYEMQLLKSQQKVAVQCADMRHAQEARREMGDKIAARDAHIKDLKKQIKVFKQQLALAQNGGVM